MSPVLKAQTELWVKGTFLGVNVLNLDLSTIPATGELPLTSDFLWKRRRTGLGFPRRVNKGSATAARRHQRHMLAGLGSDGRDACFPPAPSPRRDPAPMFAAPQECESPSTKTGSLASSLFVRNCKQTEAAVGVTQQLPSWLETHRTHLL